MSARAGLEHGRVALAASAVLLALGLVGEVESRPLLIAPFAASVALVLAVPHVPLSRPRSILTGYLLCGALGFALVATDLPAAWAQSIAVGVAVFVMQLSGTLHPPAAAVPVLVATAEPGWTFLVSPVLVGAVLLAALAALNSRLADRRDSLDRSSSSIIRRQA